VCVCVWWQLFPTSEIAATDKNVGGGKTTKFLRRICFDFFPQFTRYMRLQREAIKSRIAPLGWNKKRKMCRQCQGLIRAVQRNISPKLITTSLLFLCNSDNNNVHGNSRPTVFQSASDSSGLSFSFSRDYRWANEKNKLYQIRLDQNCVLQLTFRGGNSNRNISSWASSWVCLVFGSLFDFIVMKGEKEEYMQH
jgi:hypothetical protein